MPYDLLACGSNGSFQLGLGNDLDHSELQAVSLAPLATMTPSSLVFGASHTLMLFPDGRVFASGSNEFGQCGIEGKSLLKEFTEIPGRWKEIAAGWEFSILRSVDDEVYSCGNGPKGELGLGKDTKVARILTKIDMSQFAQQSSIKQIKASVNHVIIQLESNNFVGWGASRKGQLGEFSTAENGAPQKPPLSLWEPTLLSFSSTPEYCLGRDRTVLLQDRIEIAGRPLEFDGVSLVTALDAIELKQPLSTNKGAKVQCGWSSLHVLKDGFLQGFGKNAHGQIFPSSFVSEPILDFEVGSEHGIFLLENDRVYAWGWGEHGNCGTYHDEFSISKILEGRTVVGMTCGLASTWIIIEREN